jgi:U4/U6 small nuclear ribonucleoprotein PRP3
MFNVFFRTHEETNAKRKLSSEQKRDKRIKRASEETANGVHAAVYRVRHLDDAAKRFKVETNCKQLQMTGCVVLCKDINIIAVEGGMRIYRNNLLLFQFVLFLGPKQQKKFRRLMLHRIKWNSSGKGHHMEDGK